MAAIRRINHMAVYGIPKCEATGSSQVNKSVRHPWEAVRSVRGDTVTLLVNIKRRVERLLIIPARELGRPTRVLRFAVELSRLCAHRLRLHNITAMSAALSFRTILALIPVIILGVMSLEFFGVLEDSKLSVKRLLEGSGFSRITVLESPSAGGGQGAPVARVVNVASEIEHAVEQARAKLSFRRIGPVGIAFLVWTALTLLTTMERSLNRIFGARRPRPFTQRLPLYWSVLTLSPLLLAGAAYTGRIFSDTAATVPGLPSILSTTGRMSPIIVGILVLAAVYKTLPNTQVRFLSAIGGAVLAVPLWLIAKWGFAVYVTELVATGNLYGSLGLVPLFMIWLNLSWMIFLFGAEVAHTVADRDTLPEAGNC